MFKFRVRRLAWLVVLALIVFAMPQAASAHERRPVGNYNFVVGFLNEPSYTDNLNGLDLTVTDKDNKPVEGLEKTLKAQVVFGGRQGLDLTMRSRFGMPGKYAAYFRPTQAGQYRFHITGNINGQAVDETFESGPGRFDDVAALSALDYPSKSLSAQDVTAVQDTASLARTLALIGLAAGVAGLALGALALTRRRA